MGKYLVATAVINGVEEEFHRKGERPAYFREKHFPESIIGEIRAEINESRGFIERKLRVKKIINSLEYGFFVTRNIEPEVICRLFEIEFNVKLKSWFKRSTVSCLYYEGYRSEQELLEEDGKVFIN